MFKKKLFLPIKGTVSDVAGIFSAINNINTEKANKTVIPKVIFSPLILKQIRLINQIRYDLKINTRIRRKTESNKT